MNDLVRVLRGQRIDGRSADEIMRLAADEIERLRRQVEEAATHIPAHAALEIESLRRELADAVSECARWPVEVSRLRRELAIADDELATFRLGKHHTENETLRRELAEAREAIELAARALHGDGMADQGEAFDTAARILDAFLAGEKPR